MSLYLFKTAGGARKIVESGDPQFPPLSKVVDINLTTEQAAFYLGRKMQTLREWSCKKTGPIQPLHINGRLAWPVEKIREVVGVGKDKADSTQMQDSVETKVERLEQLADRLARRLDEAMDELSAVKQQLAGRA